MLASKAALRGRDPSIPASLVQLCNGCREQRGRGRERKKKKKEAKGWMEMKKGMRVRLCTRPPPVLGSELGRRNGICDYFFSSCVTSLKHLVS